MSKVGTKHLNGHSSASNGEANQTAQEAATKRQANRRNGTHSIASATAPAGSNSEGTVSRTASRTVARAATKRSSMLILDERIQSEFAASRDIQARILDMVQQSNFTPHSFFAIKLALEEAMINAIKHGNKLDVSKHVHIKAKVGPRVAEIMIEDEGPGFVRHEVPDPTAIENLEKCSGRGIMLIEAYMNDVEWTNKGRRLKMCKRNGEEAGR